MVYRCRRLPAIPALSSVYPVARPVDQLPATCPMGQKSTVHRTQRRSGTLSFHTFNHKWDTPLCHLTSSRCHVVCSLRLWPQPPPKRPHAAQHTNTLAPLRWPRVGLAHTQNAHRSLLLSRLPGTQRGLALGLHDAEHVLDVVERRGASTDCKADTKDLALGRLE